MDLKTDFNLNNDFKLNEKNKKNETSKDNFIDNSKIKNVSYTTKIILLVNILIYMFLKSIPIFVALFVIGFAITDMTKKGYKITQFDQWINSLF